MAGIVYTPELGRLVANAARPSKIDTVHVISHGPGKWAVVKDGNVKAVKLFSRQSTAVGFAKRYVLKFGKFVVVHDRNGQAWKTIKATK